MSGVHARDAHGGWLVATPRSALSHNVGQWYDAGMPELPWDRLCCWCGMNGGGMRPVLSGLWVECADAPACQARIAAGWRGPELSDG